MYNCKILAHSSGFNGSELITFLVTYPRIVHAEMCRHRMFSRNTASSRAIPFAKMVKDVKDNPFIPIAWQKDHKGMQGTEYFQDQDDINNKVFDWITACEFAVMQAQLLNREGTTKQLCNRLLEPFMWTTELITTSREGLMNFFDLRCPRYQSDCKIFKSRKEALLKCGNGIRQLISELGEQHWYNINHSQAEIHIQKIAEMMYDAYQESTPKQLQPGEWHMPFGDQIDLDKLQVAVASTYHVLWQEPYISRWKAKVAIARCARLSYQTLGNEPKIDYYYDIELYNRLLEQKHFSPFEHCAIAMTEEEYISYRAGKHDVEHIDFTVGDYWQLEEDSGEAGWCRNFRGFIQYRETVDQYKYKPH